MVASTFKYRVCFKLLKCSEVSGARVQQSLVEDSDCAVPVEQGAEQNAHMEDLMRIPKIVKNAFVVFFRPSECVDDSSSDVGSTTCFEVQTHTPNAVNIFTIQKEEDVVKSRNAG